MSAQAVTGVAYKRPTASRRGMSVRLMGRYIKANGTIQSTTLVVDDRGVIQDHLVGNDGTVQDLLRTYCPSTSRMPSMAAVVGALEAATVVDAAGMAAVVGSSQCLGGQPAHRLVVKVGAVPYAVCVDSAMRHAELVGPAFFAGRCCVAWCVHGALCCAYRVAARNVRYGSDDGVAPRI